MNDFTCLWHVYIKRFPKSDRYSIGQKIFNTLLDIVVIVSQAEYAKREDKIVLLETFSTQLDTVKVLIRLCENLYILSHKEYITCQTHLDEIGCMLGGWLRSLKKTNDQPA